jgi:Domain of unknown function (DUF5655)
MMPRKSASTKPAPYDVHPSIALPKRLIDTGGIAKGDRITHRIEVTSLEEIDDGLKKWLRVAYDLDAS